MPEPIYFQWQNKTLLETIYPKRKEKLIDFLVHFEEIELWKTHENMPKAELTKRKKKYEAKQGKALVEIVKVYNREKGYFLDDDSSKDEKKDAVTLYREKYKALKTDADGDELEPVRNLHKTFQLINPKGKNIYWDNVRKKNNIRKEKIFVAQRVMAWEEYRKKVTDNISRQRRRVNSIRANVRDAESKGQAGLKDEFQKRADSAQEELDRLENQILKMVDDEMIHLKALSSAYSKYEKRKLAVEKARETIQDNLEKKLGELREKKRKIRQAEEELRSVKGWLRRFNAMQSPDGIDGFMEDAKNEVMDGMSKSSLENIFGNEIVLQDRFVGNWDYLTSLITIKMGDDVRLTYVRRAMENIEAIKVDIGGRIDKLEENGDPVGLIPKLQGIVLLVLMPELEKLGDYFFALDHKVNSKAGKISAELLDKNQAREKEVQKDLKAGQSELKKLQKEIALIRARLEVPEEEELVKYEPEKEITVKDIVIEMANEYRESLSKKTQEELLETIVQLFWDNPEKFPLWLQYMVIHFSGMRYASAHGSWADPKELLGNLLASDREEENRILVNEDDVETRAQVWLRYLKSDGDQVEVEGEEPITLPLSKLSEDDAPKIASFIADLEGNFYTQRKAIHNLKMLQDKLRIEAMSPEDVLEELKEKREEKDDDGNHKIPDWMWNEIVSMTDLRIEEAKNPNWEKLTPEQEVEKNSGKWEKYRVIMNEWKEKNLTDWRESHETTGELIVTRAVCNEVAEHIQHMRGHKGASGLTQKPLWYKGKEDEFNEKWPRWKGERAYLKRPRLKSDFKEGASLLWLRYVWDYPNKWRIARTLKTDEGDELIRAEYLVKRAPGNWTYEIIDGIPRKRSVPGKTKPEEQYLRWMHEATVAAVAETAEGTVVLTFETNLPYDDRRVATIGVFKRTPHNLMDDFGEDGYNPAFVGFVPEAEKIPVEQFKHMLDWNKILLREFKPQAELDAYQEKYIRSRAVHPTEADETHKSTSRIIIKPQLAPIPPKTKLYRVRNWGDQILKDQAGLSAQTQLIIDGEIKKVGSNFNPLPLWSDSGTFSAVINALILPREDIDYLADLQTTDDGKNLKFKMNWLVYAGNYERPYWTKREDAGWETTPVIYWGTIIFGNQVVLTDGDRDVFVKLPEEKEARNVPMKQLVCFRKRDKGVIHATHPWLIHRATEVDHKDRLNTKPKGVIIYSPLWSPKDWKFAGNHQTETFYIPTDWLVPLEYDEFAASFDPEA